MILRLSRILPNDVQMRTDTRQSRRYFNLGFIYNMKDK